jgi:hypothetical protein
MRRGEVAWVTVRIASKLRVVYAALSADCLKALGLWSRHGV